MQSMRITTVAIVLGFCICAGAESTGSPLHKAIKMLEDLKAGVTKDGEREDEGFKATTALCKEESKNLKYEIKVGKSEVEDLSATISKAEADISTASSKIEDEASSQSEAEAELNSAKAIREKEHHAFTATEAELLDSIDTLERAGNVLQRKMKGTALVETSVNRNDIKALIDTLSEVVDAATLSLHDQKKLMSLAQEEDDSDLGEFGSSGKAHNNVLDMLEDLKQKAENKVGELRSEETKSRQNFEMVQQSLTDEIAAASKEINQAKDAKSAAAQTKASAEGDLSVTVKDLEGDKQSLADLDRSCVNKASDYDEAVKSRNEELHALGGALKALAESAGGAAASFMEVQSSPDRFEVVNLLRKLAQKKNNAALAQLAGRVSTVMTQAARRHGADPFKKVKEMISSMVSKIEKESKADASHKAYCDKEKKQTQEKKDDLSYSINKQAAGIDKAKAKAAGLNEEVAALQKELAQMAKQQAEADEIRRDEKDTFNQLKTDLTRGLEGVRTALKVLHAQYGETASAGGSMKAVFSMLEVVEEDTSKSLANADAEERASASEYEKLTKDNKLARHTKEEAVTYKSKESKSVAKSLAEKSSDLDGLSTEMDAVADYATNIRDECEQKPQSYADKKAQREEELEGLQDALATLNEQASLLQRAAVPRHSSLRGAAAELH